MTKVVLRTHINFPTVTSVTPFFFTVITSLNQKDVLNKTNPASKKLHVMQWLA